MADAGLSVSESTDGAISLHFSGDWLLGADLPGTQSVLDRIATTPKPAVLRIFGEELGKWDSGLMIPLIAIARSAQEHEIEIDDDAMPEGVERLVALAFAVPEREGARRFFRKAGFLETLGKHTLSGLASAKELLTFTGELTLSIGRYVRRKATYQRSDIMQYIQEAGAEALPIVSLICFLIGMIFAFVGARQLEMFSAGIYTANLVAVAMVREMSAIMTAVIMAGRTGASYAAQIGTMKVNEEIDALTTLGINPIDYLVTPRVFALIVMMPLLTLYASLMGIIGGAIVGLTMLDVTVAQYMAQTADSTSLNSLFGGLFKSVVYGTLVALAGCQQGMACGNSAMAVGQSTTRAVVMGIVLVVVSASVLTIVYIKLGI